MASLRDLLAHPGFQAKDDATKRLILKNEFGVSDPDMEMLLKTKVSLPAPTPSGTPVAGKESGGGWGRTAQDFAGGIMQAGGRMMDTAMSLSPANPMGIPQAMRNLASGERIGANGASPLAKVLPEDYQSMLTPEPGNWAQLGGNIVGSLPPMIAAGMAAPAAAPAAGAGLLGRLGIGALNVGMRGAATAGATRAQGANNLESALTGVLGGIPAVPGLGTGLVSAGATYGVTGSPEIAAATGLAGLASGKLQIGKFGAARTASQALLDRFGVKSAAEKATAAAERATIASGKVEAKMMDAVTAQEAKAAAKTMKAAADAESKAFVEKIRLQEKILKAQQAEEAAVAKAAAKTPKVGDRPFPKRTTDASNWAEREAAVNAQTATNIQGAAPSVVRAAAPAPATPQPPAIAALKKQTELWQGANETAQVLAKQVASGAIPESKAISSIVYLGIPRQEAIRLLSKWKPSGGS